MTTIKGTCGCGRSPTGNCCGWHGLTEEAYEQRKELYETGKVDIHGRDLEVSEYIKQAQELWSDSCTTPRSTK